MIKNKEILEDLIKLRKDVNEFFEKEKNNFDKGLEKIIRDLRDYLRSKEIVSVLCDFIYFMDIVGVKWKEVIIKVRIKLYDSIIEEI